MDPEGSATMANGAAAAQTIAIFMCCLRDASASARTMMGKSQVGQSRARSGALFFVQHCGIRREFSREPSSAVTADHGGRACQGGGTGEIAKRNQGVASCRPVLAAAAGESGT